MSMTTELAQLTPAGKFMFEACGQRWHHIKHGEAQYTEPRLTMVKLYQESDVLELVEALEAAEKRNAELEEKQRLIDICQGLGLEHRIAAEKRAEAAEKRIAELEESHVQVIQSRDHYKRMSEEGIKAIREARTVKLPAACADDEYFIDGVFQALRYERDVERALSAAGISVAVEGN